MKISTNKINLTDAQRSNLKDWVAALRSGEYHQGTNYLKKRKGDVDLCCCLGVACEIKNVPNKINNNEQESYCYNFDDGTVLSSTPKAYWFEKEYGFHPELNFKVHVEGKDSIGYLLKRNLVIMNDIHGFTFDKIASIIEACILNGEELEIE